MVAVLANPKKPELIAFRRKDMLSTGSTLLNLAITDCPDGGIMKGEYVFFWGISNSGKTWIGHTTLAEANRNPAFAKYRLIYDPTERGSKIDLDKHFGTQVADRIEPPSWKGKGDNRVPVYSSTVQQFYFHLEMAKRDGRPFIYVLDSENGLTSVASGEKFSKRFKAFTKTRRAAEGENVGAIEKVSGDYGDGKAKQHSQDLRMFIPYLDESKSILFVIGQSRQNLRGYGGSVQHVGGDALAFYADTQVMTTIKEKLWSKKINGKERDIGSKLRLSVLRSRITGMRNEVLVNIYPSLPGGIDDVGSCVEYLLEEDYWPLNGSIVTAKGLDIKGTKEKVIRLIEKRNLEPKLKEIVGKCWAEIQAAMTIRRKPRYL